MGRRLARIAERELARGASDHLDDGLGHVLLQAQQAQRRAALAGRAEGRGDHIVGTCSGSAVASTIIGLMPPGSAISGTMAVCFPASARWVACASSVEPVKATPATRASPTSAAPTLPSPGKRCSALGGIPA